MSNHPRGGPPGAIMYSMSDSGWMETPTSSGCKIWVACVCFHILTMFVCFNICTGDPLISN